MISNYGEFYRLAQYLFKQTSKLVAVALGVPTLRQIFDEKYYENLDTVDHNHLSIHADVVLEKIVVVTKHGRRRYHRP